jgi:hypothetical protein
LAAVEPRATCPESRLYRQVERIPLSVSASATSRQVAMTKRCRNRPYLVIASCPAMPVPKGCSEQSPRLTPFGTQQLLWRSKCLSLRAREFARCIMMKTIGRKNAIPPFQKVRVYEQTPGSAQNRCKSRGVTEESGACSSEVSVSPNPSGGFED